MKSLATFLLSVTLCLAGEDGQPNDLSSTLASPFHLLMVGVPIPHTEKRNIVDSGHTDSRHLKAIYQYDSPLKDKCHYKFKAEAITVVRSSPKRTVTRHFVKLYMGHRLLDIVEHDEAVKFSDPFIKNGMFIHRQIIDSCDQFTFEYLMKGGGCRARLYEKHSVYMGRMMGGRIMFAQDWRWKGTNEDECENKASRNFAEEFAQQHSSHSTEYQPLPAIAQGA